MQHYRVYNTQDSLMYYEGQTSSRKSALSKAISNFVKANNRRVTWDDCFEVFEGKIKEHNDAGRVRGR